MASVSEAAEALDLSGDKVRKMIHDGHLPGRKVKGQGPGGYRYEIDDEDLQMIVKKANGEEEEDPNVIIDNIVRDLRHLRRVIKRRDRGMRQKIAERLVKALEE